ncbi:MAG: type III polyketide synthase, partial [Clostridia bacterium]
MEVSRRLFSDAFPEIDRLLTIFSKSDIRKRHFAAPLDWFTEEHPFAEKNRLFIETACALGVEAVSRCLDEYGIAPEEVDCLIF